MYKQLFCFQQSGYFLLSLLAFFFIPFYVTQAGFGVSPPLIAEDKLVPGSHLEKTIYLVQGAPNRDITVEVAVESDNMKDWISFPQGSTFVIPAGVQQFPMVVEINVPESIELGFYDAYVRVNTVPDKAQNDGDVSIALGGRIDVELKIGNDVFRELSIKNIQILDIKERQDPTVSIDLINSGNVEASPEGVTFELFNKFGDLRLAYADNTFPTKIASFSEETVELTFPIDVRLAPGEYWGTVKIYDDGQVIKEHRTVFNVRERGRYDSLLAEYKSLIYGGGAGLLLLMLIIIFVVRNGSRKRPGV